MKIIEIDKQIYRKRLNIVIIAFIATFAILAVTFGMALIAMFANELPLVDKITRETPSNFKTNLLGVILALLASGGILHQLRHSPFFKEIYYVWRLKQIHNIIYRRLKKIKAAAKNESNVDINALIVLNYYYIGLKQLYLLDDNTLVISTLHRNIEELNTILIRKNIKITSDQFEQEMLASYK
ncbi:MAG: hypothetical protein ACI9LM_001680 [Alteromonadaceae bacterium]|jgi:hypothetical protein